MGCAASNDGAKKSEQSGIPFSDPFPTGLDGQQDKDEKEVLNIGDRVNVINLDEKGFLSKIKGEVYYIWLDNGLELGFERKYIRKIASNEDNLKYALKTAAPDALRRWLENGGDPCVRDGRKVPLIHLVVQRKEWFLLRKIIELGGDVDTLNIQKMTPLHLACKNGDPDTAAELLELGASVNLTCIGGVTPLHFACSHADIAFVLLLVEFGADVNCKDWNGRTPLEWALTTNQDNFVYLVAQLEGVNTELAERYRPEEWLDPDLDELRLPTPLHTPSTKAAKADYSPWFKTEEKSMEIPTPKKHCQEDAGRSPRARNFTFSRENASTPDHRTTFKRKRNAMRKMKNFLDATVNRAQAQEQKEMMDLDPAKDRPTETMVRASQVDWGEMSAHLTYTGHFKAGDYVVAQINTHYGCQEVLGIVICPGVEECKIALNQKYKIENQSFGIVKVDCLRCAPLDMDGLTTSLSTGMKITVEQWLLSPGFDFLNEPEFVTIAHWAAERGYTDILDCLHAKKIDLNCVDSRGQHILHRAAFSGQKDCLYHLVNINYGLFGHLNFEAYDDKRNNLLHYAVRGNQLDCLKFLLEEEKLERFFDVEQKDAKGHSPLHLAAKFGHIEIVKFLVEGHTADLDSICRKGLTPSQTAHRQGHQEIATFLTQYKVRKKKSFLEQISFSLKRVGSSGLYLKRGTHSEATTAIDQISYSSEDSLSEETVEQIDISFSTEHTTS